MYIILRRRCDNSTFIEIFSAARVIISVYLFLLTVSLTFALTVFAVFYTDVCDEDYKDDDGDDAVNDRG